MVEPDELAGAVGPNGNRPVNVTPVVASVGKFSERSEIAVTAGAPPNLFETFTVFKGANVFPFVSKRLSGFET